MAHTPGPWWSEYLYVYGLGADGEAEIIADVKSGLAGDVDLIEAAPRLLSACERLLANFHAVLRGAPVRDATETIAEAEAAIAQADKGA